MVKGRGLPTYQLANQAQCLYFEKGFAENDVVYFDRPDGSRSHRNLVGYRSFPSPTDDQRKRYWHFGLQAKPLLYPCLAYIAKAHVLFSDDGKLLWESKERMHRARRSQCRNWWNPKWRDRILAAISWLCDEQGTIDVPVSSSFHLKVCKHPVSFKSPVSYSDPGIQQEDEEWDEDEEEDDDFHTKDEA
jgi:hypothetical protein